MLPNIQTKDWRIAFHDRAVLVWRAANNQLASFVTLSHAQPEPKRVVAALAKSSLNLSKPPSSLSIAAAKSPVGAPPAVRSDDFPEQGVVSVSAAIVANCSADSFRNAVQDQRSNLQCFCLKISMTFKAAFKFVT